MLEKAGGDGFLNLNERYVITKPENKRPDSDTDQHKSANVWQNYFGVGHPVWQSGAVFCNIELRTYINVIMA